MTEPSVNITIKSVKTLDQLLRAWSFIAPILDLPKGKLTLQYYTEQFTKTPQLLVFAQRSNRLCGCILASVEDDYILIGPVAVSKDTRRMGIGAMMMGEVEAQAVKMDHNTLILGSVEEAEGFYLSCGFQPNLFIQIPEPGSIDQLKSLNEGYDVIWETQQEGWSRILLLTPKIDKTLQRKYIQKFPTCTTQYVFIKQLYKKPS